MDTRILVTLPFKLTAYCIATYCKFLKISAPTLISVVSHVWV